MGTFFSILLLAVGPFAEAADPPILERAERSDEDLLILGLELGSHPLSEGILAYSDKRGVLLPLGQLIDSLELPLKIDVEAGLIRGWVVDSNRRFVLDFTNKTVTLDGVAQALPLEALVEAHWDELYAGAALLTQWWPVTIHVDQTRLRAIVASTSPLPIELRLNRRAKWDHLASHGEGIHRQQTGLPPLREPYRLLDWPAIDSTVDIAWRRSNLGVSSRRARYSMLAQGDFLGMTANLFGSGTEENGSHRILSRRLTLSRTDSQGELLGPLGASDVRAGDLLGLSHPLVTHGRDGRGFGIERSRERRGNHFDSTALRGDVLPGWDVELYRGEQLLDFQTAGPDGRYEFRDIPLLMGRNDLRVSMFGPHGEQHEVVERIWVGAGALRPGEIRYRTDFVEQGLGFLGAKTDPENPFSGGVSERGQGEIVFGGTFEYGLSRRWMLSAGALSLPVEDEGTLQRHSYGWFGLEGSMLGTASRFEIIRGFESGWAGRVMAQRRLGGLGLRFEHRQFFSFLSELNRQLDLDATTELRLDGQIPLRGRRRLPVSVLSTWEQTEHGTVFRARGDFGFTTRLGPIRLANRWGVQVESSDVSAQGRATLHGRIGRLPVRGRLAYEFWPRTELTSLLTDMRWEKHPKRTTTFGLDYDVRTGVGKIRAGLDWQTRHHGFTMSFDAGSDTSFSLQLGLRFSLRRDDISRRYRLRTDAAATQGVAKAHVFLDGNGNGSFDEGDEALPNVAFELDGGRHPVTTDEEGVAYIVISSHQRTNLVVAEGSLEDPYWLSARPGVEVLTRPGRTESIEFPILATGEVDGTVYLLRGGGRVAIGGVVLELINEGGSVISSTESQYDGFYLFEKILPGRYGLRISPAAEDRWGLNNLKPVNLVVGIGVVHSGVDFHIDLPGNESDVLDNS